jgi:hypothetical protein
MKVPSTKFFYLITCSLFILGGLNSCSSLGQSSLNGINFRLGAGVTNISNVKSPNNQGTVYLQGRVIDIVPLSEPWQAYQMQDSSGKIWAITSQKGLKLNDKLLIKGNLRYQSIPIATQELGDFYVEEQERIEHTPASKL